MSERKVLIAPSLWRRMACWLYEGTLLFGVVFTAGLLFSVVFQMRNAMDSRQWLLKLFIFAVCGLYCTWLWSKGHTLAMKTWHIAIVDRFGRKLTRPRAFLRYLYCWIWFLPPLAALESKSFTMGQAIVLFIGWVAFWALLSRFHPERQFLHDALAGTRLIHDPTPAVPPR